MRHWFVAAAIFFNLLVAVGTYLWPPIGFLFGPLLVMTAVGVVDMVQTRQAIRRNFPLIGRARYLLEAIRPEINQYFIESNTDGTPFNREQRSVVYQRAKGQLDTLPFGTQMDLYAEGAEWLTHSITPRPFPHAEPRVLVGESTCKQPYSSSLLNIAAMSYGALSKNAVLALSQGAKAGGFAHNTGEGGISPYHLEGGADLIWQIGTGYFGCRAADGGFDPKMFAQNAAHPQVKMIEVKISQGAKPAHGGILPARKVTEEIAQIRGVPLGQDVLSPPAHREFSNPKELVSFITRLRELSGGKPIGIKLCLGKRREFLALCKAMVESGQHPDYIAVDGAEGGTGAAPIEFSNRLGIPLTEAVVFVHNALQGVGLRQHVKVIAAGKVATGFHIAKLLAIGADACYSARAMMMAIGCIQARRCNANDCPTGVATQRPSLVKGLDVADKAERTNRYHKETIESFTELMAACGFSDPQEFRPWNLQRRTGPNTIRHYGEIFNYLEAGQLLQGDVPAEWKHMWTHATSESFDAIGDNPNFSSHLPPVPPATSGSGAPS